MKSGVRNINAWALVVLLVALAPSSLVYGQTTVRLSINGGFGFSSLSGNLALDMGDPVDIGGYTGRIGTVLSNDLTGIHDLLGVCEIIYDTANPAPPCTLLSVTPGEDLFPAIQTLYLNWILVCDSFPDMTLRTISPVTLVSEELPNWPTQGMTYAASTDAYFEDIANPGDTVLDLSLEGTTGSIGIIPIPSLTTWGVVVLSVLLAMSGVYVYYHRRRSLWT